MEDRVLIKDIRHEYFKDEPVCHWQCEPIDYHTKLFHKPMEDGGSGFYFYCINRTSSINDEWDGSTDSGECMFQGIAYFDGIRHMYYGAAQTDNFGYHFYPTLNTIIKALQTLRVLEEKYCDYLYS